MDSDLATPKQAISSLASIAPFLWPFVLLSLGVALTPVSPISWSYSTWMLFIIPLIITVFAPIRTFSGPLRYAYLEYASRIASLLVSLLKAVITNFHSVPTLALPALFFLPVLPILFFVFFPALPMAWHFTAYHYRRCLKAITTSADTTNVRLDLAISRARQAMALAHTFEKQALYTISTTRSSPLLALPRHSTDFDTPLSNESDEQRLVQRPGTLGAELAGKVLDTEKQMVVIENDSQRVRTLTEQAVAIAVEGDMAKGEALVADAANSLENVVQQVDELRSIADQVRSKWIEYRRRLNSVTTSASTTVSSLDLAITRAQQAMALAHTFEKQALYTISTIRSAPLLALPRHSTDFDTPLSNESDGQQLVHRPGTLGAGLAEKVLDTEKQMAIIEVDSHRVRALTEQAVAVAVEGDMVEGEKLAGDAANSLENVVKQVDELHLVADQVRSKWIEYRRRLNSVTTSASTTISSLDLTITRAQQAMALAHTFEKQALYTISTTRSATLLALPRNSTDLDTPVSNKSDGQLVQMPGTLGAELAEKVLDTEKQMAVIENDAQRVRALTEQAVAVAVEGDMVEGEKLADDAANSLENVVKQVDELRSVADQVRSKWIEYRRRLNSVTTSASTTISSLDLAVARAQQAIALAHTYEKQALYTISTTRSAPLLALPRHSTDFGTSVSDESEGQRLVQRPGTLGAELAGKVLDTEKQMAVIENDSQRVRAFTEQAIAVAVEGDMVEGERLARDAENLLEKAVKQVDELGLVADQARRTWTEYRRRLNTVTTTASTTIASLELVVTRARRATSLAHTYETQALSVVSTTRRTASVTLALHGVDFFDTSVSAWAAIGHATAETQDLVVAVRGILPLADKLRQSQPPNEDILSLIRAEELYERAKDVVGAASKAEQESRQAQGSVTKSKNAKSRVTKARRLVKKEAERVRVLGVKLTEKMLGVEEKITIVESEAENIRALLEEAVAVAVDGDVAKGESLTSDAADLLRHVDECIHGLCSIGDEVRLAWVELSVEK